MKKLTIKLALLSVILFASLLDAKELFRDVSFNNGINLLGTIDGNINPIGKLCRSGNSCNPSWFLAEWYSDMNLVGGNPGNYWANPYKALTVWNRGFRLALNGSSEDYTGSNGCPSIANWPSLIVEQRWQENISSLKSLNLKYKATLEYFNKVTKNNCFTTQLNFYLVIKDIASKKSFWFGVPIFDNRKSSFDTSIAFDNRTNMWMYHIGNKNPLVVNRKGRITNNQSSMNLDILPAIKETALKNHFNINNIAISYAGFAVENPSNNIATFKVEDISLSTNESMENSNTGNAGVSNSGTKNKVFNFNSNKNREGWRSINMNEQFGGPNGGKWYFACNKYDPMLVSPRLSLNGSIYKKVQITMANDHNPSKHSYIKVYWKRKGDRNFSESRSAYTRIHNDGGWRTYTLYPQWSGEISEIRVDPIAGGDGHWIGIDAINIVR